MRGSAMGVLATVLVAFCMPGCGRKSAQPPKPAAQKGVVPLPEWAPKNPSPEFLRAAGVLKPIPFTGEEEASAGPEEADLTARIQRTWPAAYELFGTLTDEQIQRFQSTKDIRIPVRSLTRQQRTALDRYFEVWRMAIKGSQHKPDDVLVDIYKRGGKQDLSNVAVGFYVRAHLVDVIFWITQVDGKVPGFGYSFAQI